MLLGKYGSFDPVVLEKNIFNDFLISAYVQNLDPRVAPYWTQGPWFEKKNMNLLYLKILPWRYRGIV